MRRTATVTSKTVCVKVRAKLTLCVTPPMYGGVAISGTLVPGWDGGKVTITIAKVVHCGRTVKVATLTVPLDPGVWRQQRVRHHVDRGAGNTTYVFTVKVATTADFNGACVSKVPSSSDLADAEETTAARGGGPGRGRPLFRSSGALLLRLRGHGAGQQYGDAAGDEHIADAEDVGQGESVRHRQHVAEEEQAGAVVGEA